MAITIQNQKFGVEIELTGITRETAAKTIADYYGTRSLYAGGSYRTYTAADNQGRIWKAMNDSSIHSTHIENGRRLPASSDYCCEIVTPILQYSDIDDLQKIVRKLVEKGAVANSSCGIHVHIDGANHTPQSLTRLLNFAIGRQDLFYEALEINNNRMFQYCKKMSLDLLKAMKNDNEKTVHSMEAIWYSTVNDDYNGGIDHNHYNSTRYHGINLHAFFTKGTVEFRLFNGTTHAGKIKAYIQFCLAMSAWAVNANDKMYYKSCASYSTKQKGALMERVLVRRLGMSGAEFKTARYHLTKAFKKTAEEISA